jgi:uncharacterized paraquat-inducible protein A
MMSQKYRTLAAARQQLTRRSLFTLAMAAPAAVYVTRAAAGTCADLDSLSASQKSLRQSLNFKPVSDDSRHCSGCAFFTANANDGNCGACQIFNGPTSAQSRCDSWAARK